MINLQDQVADSYTTKGPEPETSWANKLQELKDREAARQAAEPQPAPEEAAPAPPEVPPTPDQAPIADQAIEAAPGDGAPGAAPDQVPEGERTWWGFRPSGEKRTKKDYVLDTVAWLTRPLGFLGAASLAPASRPHEPDEGFFEDIYKDFRAAGEAAAGELFPTWGEDIPSYGGAVADIAFGQNTKTSQFLGPMIDVMADPGLVLGGAYSKILRAGVETAQLAGSTGKMLGTGGIIHRGLLQVFSAANVDLAAPSAKKAVQLAREAETGGKAAAQRFQAHMKTHYADALQQFEIKSIKAEADKLSYYHVPLKNPKTGQIVTNKYGQPMMMRRPPPPEALRKEAIVTSQRRVGSVRLLRRELNGNIISRPFRFRKNYLDINTPGDVDGIMANYAKDATNYFTEAYKKADRRTQIQLERMLKDQKRMLAKEIGDKVNMQMTDQEAFGMRMMLRDLGSGIKATIAAGGTTVQSSAGNIARGITSGYKYQELVDHLRFWKLTLARESLRSTLSVTRINATGAFARINTRTPGDSPAIKLLMVSRAKDALPKPSPEKVQMLADSFERLGSTHAANEYLNKLFSPGGMKLMGDVTPTKFKVLNKVLAAEDKMYGAYVDALLSNPVTHFRNIVDTGSLMLYQDAKEFTAALPAVIRNNPDAMMHVQAGVARMHGHIEAIGDLFRLSAKEKPTMLGNVDDFANMHEAMLSRSRPQLSPRGLQNASRLTRMADKLNHMRPTAFLGKADAVLKSIEYRAALRAEAMKRAKALGGDDWKQTRKLYEEFVDSPLEQMKLEAFGSAEKYTFQQPFDPESWFERNVLRGISGVPFIRFTTPFVRTPYQIIKRGMEDGPLAIINPKNWGDVMAGGPQADNAMANVMLATGGMMYLALNTNEELLTGGVPGVQTARGQWLIENQFEPYSMGSRHERFSFKNLGPLRWIAGTAANLRDLAHFTDWDSMDGPDAWERAVSGSIAAFGEPISDSFFLDNFVKTIDAFARSTEPGFMGRLGSVAESIALGMATPGAMRAANELMNDRARQATTFVEKIMAQTPGLSDNLPEKTDILGYPVTRSYWHKFTPLLLDPKNPSPVATELRRVNARLNDVAKDYNGLLKFTTQERAAIRQIRNEGIFPYPGIEELLNQRMDAIDYRDAAVETKAEIITATISAINKMALDYYISNNQDLMDRIVEAEEAEMERLRRAQR